MTLTDILLLANGLIFGAIALWQGHRIAALDAKMADKTHLRLLAEAIKLRVQRIDTRQDALAGEWQAFLSEFPGRMKAYVPREAYAKLENNFDTRVRDIVTGMATEMAARPQKLCNRCDRLVARYELFPDGTVICANCSYKPHEK